MLELTSPDLAGFPFNFPLVCGKETTIFQLTGTFAHTKDEVGRGCDSLCSAACKFNRPVVSLEVV